MEIVPDLKSLDHLRNDYERVEYFMELLVTYSTGGGGEDKEYKCLRSYFLQKKDYESLLPDFIRLKRDLGQFWSFIKKYETYAERRMFLWDVFSALLNYLETKNSSAVSVFISNNQLIKFTVNTVHFEIQKGLERVKSDPEGAITLARTVLESVCKFISDERGVEYNDNTELSVLYKNVAKELNLSPDQHHEEIFRQILGGCSAVVNGLGTLRNKLGDAHGKGVFKVKPSSRHAELAVNLAGSMAVFLVETHDIN
ncbi:MAG TPA: abortive infection family protein [Candidatus Paceibacterota bacterium]|nr:abortive infection family protein [Candidatus Paceibacterota bacterium]